MHNPESDEAKDLLKSATAGSDVEPEARVPSVLPWWEAQDVVDEEDEGKFAASPETVDEGVLEGVRPPEGSGSRLAYNAVVIRYDSPMIVRGIVLMAKVVWHTSIPFYPSDFRRCLLPI